MRHSFAQNVVPLWRTYSSPGLPLRTTSVRAAQIIYGLWLSAFVLKLLGSSWDMAWHFHYLRDDLAPPHLINTVGTMLAVALVVFHTWTGYAVDRLSVRLMQAGVATFLLAIPLDILNHRLFGLDITSWSPTHALLYVGTAVMLMGVLRGWLLLAPTGGVRTGLAIGLWALLLEDVLFVLGQQEYGVLSLAALQAGRPTADAELLAVAGSNPGIFIVPVPAWVYPLWLVAMAPLVLLTARVMLGGRWTATLITATYLAYRVGLYYLLVASGFPPSYIPVLLLGAAIAIDVAVTLMWRPAIAALVVLATFYAGAALTRQFVLMPDFPLNSLPVAGVLLWGIWASVVWVQTSPLMLRWSKPT